MTGPAKILAVDDEADIERLIRQRFRRQIRAGEFELRFAHHGEEALSAIAAEPDIDLLLLDINMPIMDGLTLLSVLRERQSPVRSIIISAYGDMANIRTAMNRGAFDFVTKPVDLADLEITIRKTLDEIGRVRELDRRRAAAERARANLARYFSPNIAEILAEHDQPLGEVRRQTVGVLFVDIVGFTRMAERMAPETVVTMLRQFHQRITAQIFACGGTVEKYIGDAVFAVFGLPNAGPDDAANAHTMRGADDLHGRRMEQRAELGRRAPARDRHRAQLRPGRDRRRRQRAGRVVHGDRRHRQHSSPTAGADSQLRNAARRRRSAGRRGQDGPLRRHAADRPVAGSRRAFLTWPDWCHSDLDAHSRLRGNVIQCAWARLRPGSLA